MTPIFNRLFAPLVALAFALVGGGCTPLEPTVAAPTATPSTSTRTPVPVASPTPTPALPPGGCEGGQVVWPKLAEVQPAQAAPGAEVTVIGSGGYVRCADGAYNESARQFDLFLDGQAAGSLSCYVNRCEARFVVPASIAAGQHVLTAEGGSEIVLDVTA
jgi:hypothetical protein